MQNVCVKITKKTKSIFVINSRGLITTKRGHTKTNGVPEQTKSSAQCLEDED
jgi:hypothetical protein